MNALTSMQVLQVQRAFVRILKQRFPNLTVEDVMKIAGDLALALANELDQA